MGKKEKKKKNLETENSIPGNGFEEAKTSEEKFTTPEKPEEEENVAAKIQTLNPNPDELTPPAMEKKEKKKKKKKRKKMDSENSVPDNGCEESVHKVATSEKSTEEDHATVEVQNLSQNRDQTPPFATEKEKKKKMKLGTENSIPQVAENSEETEKAMEKPKPKETENVTVKFRTLSQNPDKMPPFVGYFPSGYDPLINECSVNVFRNTKRSNRLQLVVSPNDSTVNFVGTSYSGEATAPQLCNYRIGLYNKETQTVEMIPIAANKIFRLDPVVGGSDIPEDENVDKQKQLTAEEKSLKMRALTEMYSNNKARRKAKKLDALHIQVDAGAQQEIEGNTLLNLEALQMSVTTDVERNIPPYDLAATTPQTAYPLDKIISKGEWDYLSDIFDLSEAGEHITLDHFPSFVCHRVYKLADIEDETERRILAGIFSYITHLVKFKDKHSMDGISSAKNHKIPGMLFQKFSSMFGSSESKRLPARKIDLLISYVLVLTLYADNFQTDPSDIAKDLRMTAGDLRPRFELLGCKCVREKLLHLFTLHVPLQFPTIRRKRRR